jgi:hypothetical protein
MRKGGFADKPASPADPVPGNPSGGREPEARELLAHPRPDDLPRRGGPEHHLHLRDASVLVEGERVDALDLPPVHLGRELQERHTRVAVLEPVDVAEVAADSKHPLGCSKDSSTASRPA